MSETNSLGVNLHGRCRGCGAAFTSAGGLPGDLCVRCARVAARSVQYEQTACPQAPPSEPPSAGPRVNDPMHTLAASALNKAIDEYRGNARLDAPMPVLNTTQEVWDAIVDGSKKSGNWINDPKYAGIDEYRGCRVTIVKRDGVWVEAVPPARANDDLCAFGEILVGQRPVESPYNGDSFNQELFNLLSSHGLTLVDDELHQVARAAARCYPDVRMHVHQELPGAGGASEEECPEHDGEPVSSGLPAILAFFVGAITGVFLAWAFLSIQ